MSTLNGPYWKFVPSVAALLLAASCSSSDDGGSAAPPVGASDAGGDADEPSILGTGAACTQHTQEVVGIKVSLDVNWPATPGTLGCASADGCDGKVSLWLLSKFNISGHETTGTTTTCGNQMPASPLTQIGSEGEGVPGGGAKVTIQFPASMWDAVAMNPAKGPTPASGEIGGWNIGSSFKVAPTVAFFGIKPSSSFASASTVWPGSESALTADDLSDDDNDGHPGITAVPASTDGNVLPATGIATAPPLSPQADKLYIALRTVLSFYGKATSCSEIDGSAKASVFNDHVVGCHLASGSECTAAEWDFIDQLSTVYVGSGVTIPPSTPAASAPSEITGTFVAKTLAYDNGASVDCAAVRAALP
jgi:hypothetical protein